MLIWDHQNNCLLTECHHTIAAHQHLRVFPHHGPTRKEHRLGSIFDAFTPNEGQKKLQKTVQRESFTAVQTGGSGGRTESSHLSQ